MSSQSNRIFGLDVVRATAILLVLISHSTILLFPNSTNNIVFIIQFFGTIGVDIFFVLSGYLIGRILLKQIQSQKFTFKNILYFWIRRWFRTLPNYYLILIINILIFYFFYDKFVPDILHYFVFLQNFNEVQSDFFTESWSLSIEEFAYILGPLLLLLIYTIVKKQITRHHFLFVVFAVIVMFVLSRYWFHENASDGLSWSGSLRKVVIYRIDAIYYGFIGAYISEYARQSWNNYKNHCFVLGLMLFAVIHGLIVVLDITPSVNSVFFNILYLPLVSISILLTFPVFSNWLEGHSSFTFVTTISKWSYALYLINYSIILLSIQFYISMEEQHIMTKLFILLVFWSLSFLMAYLLYTYYEKPMMDLRDGPLFKKLAKSK